MHNILQYHPVILISQQNLNFICGDDVRLPAEMIYHFILLEIHQLIKGKKTNVKTDSLQNNINCLDLSPWSAATSFWLCQ